MIGISADVRDFKAMAAAVERTVAELGRIDYVMCVSFHESDETKSGEAD